MSEQEPVSLPATRRDAAVTLAEENRRLQSADWLLQLPQLNGDEQKMIELQRQCYNAFLAKEVSLRDVAVQFSVPMAVLSDWAKLGKWSDRRLALRNDLLVQVEQEYLEFVKSNRVQTASGILESVNPLVEKIAKAMGETLDAGPGPVNTIDLRRFAEALKSVSDIVQQAVALSGALPVPVKPEQEKSVGDGPGGKPAFFRMDVNGPVNIRQE